jgi:O-antigen ligase
MEKKPLLLLLSVCATFIVVNCWAIAHEFFSVPLLSATFAVVYIAIFRFDLLLYFMAFITPFSIPLSEISKQTIDISLPAEVIMLTVTFLFFARSLYGIRSDVRFLKHPVTVAIYFYLFWLLITSITSTMPLVSFKFLASKIWFIVSCYFVMQQFFQHDRKNIVRIFGCYAVGLALVVIMTTIKHAGYGFSEFSGRWVMNPYYNDHTAYGAVLALFIPITFGFAFLPDLKKSVRIFYVILTAIFLLALFLSFSRAAWLSLMLGIGVWCILKWRIKLSWVIIAIIVLGGAFYSFSDDILYRMSRNSQDSSENLVEHLQSITNITTDASNVERLNRWAAAGDMIKAKPITGWGPGTYQFNYAPFQQRKYKTIITTNFGDGGNAHSEYIGPFAEAGILGFLSVLVLVFLILYFGIKTYVHSPHIQNRILALSFVIALITYFMHGILNNFLDTDKLSLPYWAAFAGIVALMERKQVEK